ncbi:hypothetical protein NQ315_012260 [Exocentrus adspersus]|uniref:DDE Tnp4 domain-containing protein n=1 Tax=Exocentrus adspersus TaxID=1586481 RepID=A0AAV8VEF9_9CUCU|nr:hypothetical protein NQ315_012260 [Exocentrus adspersus]
MQTNKSLNNSRSIADRFDVSKSTVFYCLKRVCVALNKEAKNVIKRPKNLAAVSVIQGFRRCKSKSFPGVIGAIDGCHIEINIGKENTCAYVNRKGTTSIILQAVCDYKCMFTDIFVGFPGSVHDARVFSKSPLATLSDEFFPEDSHLLGDSAYPLRKHMIVPFTDNGHLSQSQKKFNIAHASTRVAIERTFGLLKGRWRRLKYLEIHVIELIPQIVSAACVLHNFCSSDEISEDDILSENTPDCNQMNPEHDGNYPGRDREGVRKRNSILLQF